jgi:hypothetical protein
VIILEDITYSKCGAMNLFLRNSKSNFVIGVGIWTGSYKYPITSIGQKFLFDPVHGIIIE